MNGIGLALGIVGVASGVGWVLSRSWRRDRAIRSGEVMDIRDVLPDGDADCVVRVLGERLYRVELQLTAFVADGVSDALPYRLVLSRQCDDGEGEIVYAGERSLASLVEFASGTQRVPGGRTLWGCLPLLEFRSPELVRLRFEVELPVIDDRGGECAGRLEKASLVVKEMVRPMPARKAQLDRVTLAGFGHV